MQKEDLQQKIGEFYVRLPEDLRGVFSDMGWMEKVRTIGVKNYLNDRQKEILITETTLVLLGIINTYDYESNLANELGLSGEPLTKLIKDLDESVFIGIKEKLNDAFANNVEYLMNSRGGIEKIDESFTKLPEDIQEWIDNSNYQLKIYGMGEKYNLTATQMLDIEEVVSKVMMGKLSLLKYEDELKLKLGDISSNLNPILYEIKENILKGAEEKLNKLNVLNKIQATKIETSGKDEDIIPKPPYAQMITNNYDLKSERVNNVKNSILVSKPAPKSEKEIYTNSGIEIVGHQEEAATRSKIDPYREDLV